MAQIGIFRAQILEALGFGEQETLRRSQLLADLILAEWTAEARKKLNTTLDVYKRSLQVRDVSSKGFTCGLPASPSTAILAHMVEQGMGSGGIGTSGPYDVRKYLLRASTRNIRRSKAGNLYLHVPFGRKAKDIRASFGAQAANRARRLSATMTDADRKTRYGGRLPAHMVPKLKPHHVSDPLAGMVRMASTYSKGRGGKPRKQTSTYRTWRTASYTNTNPKAWLSSGIKARRIMDDVTRQLPTLISQVY